MSRLKSRVTGQNQEPQISGFETPMAGDTESGEIKCPVTLYITFLCGHRLVLRPGAAGSPAQWYT